MELSGHCLIISLLYIFTYNLVHCAAPENGVNTQAVDTNLTVPEGKEYTYSCADGLVTEDTLTTVCRADGSWSIPPPSCPSQYP